MINMRKKGQTEIMSMTMLFEVLGGFLIGGLLVLAILQTGNMEYFSVSFIQADHDVLLSVIRSLPGDVELSYSIGNYYYKDGSFSSLKSKEIYYLKIEKNGEEIKEISTREK